MRVDVLLKTDKATLTFEALPDGKIRVNASAWSEPKVILPSEVIELRSVERQLRIARKDREHDDADPKIEAYDPYGPGVTELEAPKTAKDGA